MTSCLLTRCDTWPQPGGSPSRIAAARCCTTVGCYRQDVWAMRSYVATALLGRSCINREPRQGRTPEPQATLSPGEKTVFEKHVRIVR